MGLGAIGLLQYRREGGVDTDVDGEEDGGYG